MNYLTPLNRSSFIFNSPLKNSENTDFMTLFFLNSKAMKASASDEQENEDAPKEHLPEDKDPNEKPHPVRDPDDKDSKKKTPKKEDYLPEGDERYVKQPTREADDPYLAGHEDDLENDKNKRPDKFKPED